MDTWSLKNENTFDTTWSGTVLLSVKKNLDQNNNALSKKQQQKNPKPFCIF